MVKKTKEDALLTKQQLIDSARTIFLDRGVSRTTLEQIATHAGVTRGAIYWHFKSKQELFHEMRQQVFLPLIDRMDTTLLENGGEDPLQSLENFLCNTIDQLTNSPETRQIYEIMMIKCEYVNEFEDVLRQIMVNCSGIREKIETTYRTAQEKNLISAKLCAYALSMDTHLFFSGLLHMWVKDLAATELRPQALQLIRGHIALRRNNASN